MRDLLKAEKPPFFISILLGAFAWAVLNYVETIQNTPVILYKPRFTEHQLSEDETTETAQFEVYLENLTENILFTNLEFVIRSEKTFDAFIMPIPPAWDADSSPSGECETAVFFIEEFHPGGKIKLHATVTNPFSKTNKPAFFLRSSDQAIQLIKPSVRTVVLKRQEIIIFSFLFAWAIFTLLLYWFYSLTTESSNVSSKAARKS